MHNSTLSIVIPTYNCRDLMLRHLDHIDRWIDLATEVFVVDSRSTDGTLELIQERLQHPKLNLILRDRGLYQSWNEGIRATSGDWVYISTAGDTIQREQLIHLLETGERLCADVVVSNPRFTLEDGSPQNGILWPPLDLIRRFSLREAAVFDPEITQYLALESYPNAILGSSASNLYRGTHIRARPFPTDHGRSGDTAWIVRFGHETRFCLTPREGSTFCFHTVPNADVGMDYVAMLDEELARLHTSGYVSELTRFFIDKELPARRRYGHAVDVRRQAWREKRSLVHRLVFLFWSNLRCFRRRSSVLHTRSTARRIIASTLQEQEKRSHCSTG